MATIKDVAERAGVAVATVSRVMNNRGSISDKMRKRVQAAMDELNYQPNELARALQRQHSRLIAVIVREIDHPFFSRMVQAAERALAGAGYHMLLFTSQGSTAQENAFLPAIRATHVDGVLLCGQTDDEITSVFPGCGIPLVTVDRDLGPHVPMVCCDNREGGRLAADALYRSGCRHPLVFRSPDVPAPGASRVAGFLQRCEELDVAPLISAQSPLPALDANAYHDFYADLFRAYPAADGLFAISDLAAAGACVTLREMGRRVPEEVQVIGFDGIPIGDFLDLTTIAQPVEAIGAFAAGLLLQAVEGQTIPWRSYMPVNLLERQTTRQTK